MYDSYTLFDKVIQFFTEDEWNFFRKEDQPLLYMNFSGTNGNWQCLAQVDEEENRFFFYSRLDVKVPVTKRVEIAEYLTRANYGLNLGNFEMDFRDGEIRFKNSIDVKGGELSQEMIKVMVYTNVLITDRYFPGIMKVVFANVSAEDAIEEIENAPN